MGFMLWLSAGEDYGSYFCWFQKHCHVLNGNLVSLDNTKQMCVLNMSTLMPNAFGFEPKDQGEVVKEWEETLVNDMYQHTECVTDS